MLSAVYRRPNVVAHCGPNAFNLVTGHRRADPSAVEDNAALAVFVNDLTGHLDSNIRVVDPSSGEAPNIHNRESKGGKIVLQKVLLFEGRMVASKGNPSNAAILHLTS